MKSQNINISDEAWATLSSQSKWEEIVAARNLLLANCDWTQLPDAALTLAEKTAWQDYRQALRDIPQTFANPDDVVFPEAPQ